MISKGVRNICNWMLVIFGMYPALFMFATNMMSTGDATALCTFEGGGSLSIACTVPLLDTLLLPAQFIWFFYAFGLIFIAVPILVVCLVVSLLYEIQQGRATGKALRAGILIPLVAFVLFALGFTEFFLKLLRGFIA